MSHSKTSGSDQYKSVYEKVFKLFDEKKDDVSYGFAVAGAAKSVYDAYASVKKAIRKLLELIKASLLESFNKAVETVKVWAATISQFFRLLFEKFCGAMIKFGQFVLKMWDACVGSVTAAYQEVKTWVLGKKEDLVHKYSKPKDDSDEEIILEAQGVLSSVPVLSSLLELVVGACVAVLGVCLAGDWSKRFDTVRNWANFCGRLKLGPSLEGAINWVSYALTGKDVWVEFEVRREWHDTVENTRVVLQEIAKVAHPSRAQAMRVNQCHDKLVECYLAMLQLDKSDFSVVKTYELLVKETVKYKSCRGCKRIKPVVVCLRGKAGTGKTTIINNLCSDIPKYISVFLDRFDDAAVEYMRVQAANPNPLVVNCVDEVPTYDDGYLYNMFYVFNEYLTTVSSTARQKWASRFLKVMDDSPLMLNMAFEEKGKVYFNSPFVFASGNFDVHTIPCNNPDAYYRRLEFDLDVTHPNGEAFDVSKCEFVVQPECRRISSDPRLSPFRCYGRLSDGKVEGLPQKLTYDELLKAIVMEYVHRITVGAEDDDAAAAMVSEAVMRDLGISDIKLSSASSLKDVVNAWQQSGVQPHDTWLVPDDISDEDEFVDARSSFSSDDDCMIVAEEFECQGGTAVDYLRELLSCPELVYLQPRDGYVFYASRVAFDGSVSDEPYFKAAIRLANVRHSVLNLTRKLMDRTDLTESEYRYVSFQAKKFTSVIVSYLRAANGLYKSRKGEPLGARDVLLQLQMFWPQTNGFMRKSINAQFRKLMPGYWIGPRGDMQKDPYAKRYQQRLAANRKRGAYVPVERSAPTVKFVPKSLVGTSDRAKLKNRTIKTKQLRAAKFEAQGNGDTLASCVFRIQTLYAGDYTHFKDYRYSMTLVLTDNQINDEFDVYFRACGPYFYSMCRYLRDKGRYDLVRNMFVNSKAYDMDADDVAYRFLCGLLGKHLGTKTMQFAKGSKSVFTQQEYAQVLKAMPDILRLVDCNLNSKPLLEDLARCVERPDVDTSFYLHLAVWVGSFAVGLVFWSLVITAIVKYVMPEEVDETDVEEYKALRDKLAKAGLTDLVAQSYPEGVKPPKPGSSLLEKLEAKGAVMFSQGGVMDGSMAKVVSNRYAVLLDSGVLAGSMTYVFGQIALINRHVYQSLGSTFRTMPFVNPFKEDVPSLFTVRKASCEVLREDPEHDLILAFIPSYKQHKSLVKQFLTRAESPFARNVPGMVSYYDQVNCSGNMDPINLHWRGDAPFKSAPGKGFDTPLCDYYNYYWDGARASACGSLVMVQVSSSWKIIGVHCAGDPARKLGLCTSVFSELFEGFDFRSLCSGKYAVVKAYHALPLCEDDNVHGMYTLESQGFVTEVKTRCTDTTCLVPTVFEELEFRGGCGKAPACLDYEAYQNGRIKEREFVGVLKPNVMAEVMRDKMTDCIIDSFVGEADITNCRSLVAGEVLWTRGILPGFDPSTSKGLRMRKWGLSKRALLAGDPATCEVFEERILEIRKAQKDGDYLYQLNFDKLKDELRDLDRVKAKKTRVFKITDFVDNVLIKMAIGDLVGRTKHMILIEPSACGINPYGEAWRVLSVMFPGVAVATDVRGFESVVSPYIFPVVWELIYRAYDDPDDRAFAMWAVVSCVHGLRFDQGKGFWLGRQNTSGNWITTWLNTLANHIFFSVACGCLALSHGIDPLVAYNGFVGKYYADDNITACPFEWYTAENLAVAFKDLFGIELTGTTKGQVTNEECMGALSDLEFLSRGFRFERGLVFCPLKSDSLYGRLHFVKVPKKSRVDPKFVMKQLQINLESFALELYEYDVVTGDALAFEVVQFIERHRLPVRLPYVFNVDRVQHKLSLC